jgi:hypothetical protein
MGVDQLDDHELLRLFEVAGEDVYRTELTARFCSDDPEQIRHTLSVVSCLPTDKGERFLAEFRKGARQLPTRYSPATGRFQIHVDGRWRQNRRWWDTCFHCGHRSDEPQRIALLYYGILAEAGDEDSLNFWGMCPRCGERTSVEWVGKPVEHHPGGQEHGWLRERRKQATY